MRMDSRGSAYAWAMFFVFMWIFATVWFFAISPLWKNALQTANVNSFTGLPGASAFYSFFSSVYPYIPLFVFVLALIGFLKYASSINRGGL